MKSAIIEAAEVIEETAASLRKNFGTILSTGKFVCFGTEAREEYRRLKKLAQRLRDAADQAPIASCCGREECGGECGNEYRGMTSDAERRAEALTPPPPPTQESEND